MWFYCSVRWMVSTVFQDLQYVGLPFSSQIPHWLESVAFAWSKPLGGPALMWLSCLPVLLSRAAPFFSFHATKLVSSWVIVLGGVLPSGYTLTSPYMCEVGSYSVLRLLCWADKKQPKVTEGMSSILGAWKWIAEVDSACWSNKSPLGERGEYLESRTQLSVGWDHVFIVNPKWSAHNFMWLKQMD